MALLVYLRPMWFVLGFVLTLGLVLGVVLIFGVDRLWGSVFAYLERIETTAPSKARRMRKRLDRFAQRWDHVLDMFPDGTVDGLYLPDFQAMEAEKERHAAAVEKRFAKLASEA